MYGLTREEPFSSPSLKSGVGFALENKVGALYLTRLLLDHRAKGFTKKLKSVGFFAWAPRGLDDIMLVFDDEDNTRALIQMKRTLTFTNNDEFRKVITNYVNAFMTDDEGFDPSHDVFAIGIGRHQTGVENNLLELLKWAEHNENFENFEKLLSQLAASNPKKKYFDLLKTLFECTRANITKNEIFCLLKRLKIIYFDLI